MRRTILRHPYLCIALLTTLRYPKKPLSNCHWSWVSVGGVEGEHRTAGIAMYGIAPRRESVQHRAGRFRRSFRTMDDAQTYPVRAFGTMLPPLQSFTVIAIFFPSSC